MASRSLRSRLGAAPLLHADHDGIRIRIYEPPVPPLSRRCTSNCCGGSNCQRFNSLAVFRASLEPRGNTVLFVPDSPTVHGDCPLAAGLYKYRYGLILTSCKEIPECATAGPARPEAVCTINTKAGMGPTSCRLQAAGGRGVVVVCKLRLRELGASIRRVIRPRSRPSRPSGSVRAVCGFDLTRGLLHRTTQDPLGHGR